MYFIVVCFKTNKEIFILEIILYYSKVEISPKIGSRDVNACLKFEIYRLSQTHKVRALNDLL